MRGESIVKKNMPMYNVIMNSGQKIGSVSVARIAYFSLLISILLSVFSCNTIIYSGPGKDLPVYLIDEKPVYLLDTEYIETTIDEEQYMEGYHGDESYLLQTMVVADETKIEQYAMTTFGAMVYFLQLDDTVLHFESPYVQDGMNPSYLAADFQLVYYKPEAVRQMLNEAGLVLKIDKNDSLEIRTIYHNDSQIIEIRKEKDRVVFTNYLRNYGYSIQTY